MNTKISFLTLLLFYSFLGISQVKIGDNPTTINDNSIFEVESTNKGILLPRVALTATNAVAPLFAHVAGMTIYNTATAGTAPNNVVPGYYYNNGSAWVRLITDNDGDAWGVDGESLTSAISRTGTVTVGTISTEGAIRLTRGTSTRNGLLSIYKPDGLRQGYVGWIANQMYYAAENGGVHQFNTNLGIGVTPTAKFHNNGTVKLQNLATAPSNEDLYLLGINPSTHEVKKLTWSELAQENFSTTLNTAMDAWDTGQNTVSGVVISGQQSGHLVLEIRPNEVNDGLIVANDVDDLLMKVWGVTGNLRIMGAVATKAAGTTWATPSDKRIKKNIEDFNDGLDIIKALRPVTYQFNGKAGMNNDGITHIGFIAQELEMNAPYMVSENKGITPDGIKNLKIVDESALTKILINAIKQQQKQIEELKSNYNVLKAEASVIQDFKKDLEAIKKELAVNNHAKENKNLSAITDKKK